MYDDAVLIFLSVGGSIGYGLNFYVFLLVRLGLVEFCRVACMHQLSLARP